MILYAILIVGLLAFKLSWDWFARKKEGRIINHARSAAIDFAIYCAGAWFFFSDLEWWNYIGLIGSALAFRWTFFDLLYNLIFNNKWSYCGDNSVIDQIADGLDGRSDDDCTMAFYLKLILLIGGIILIIL